MEGPEPALSLYVHVPFCVDKCLYCDFFSVPRHTVAADIQDRVVAQIIEQAKFFGDALGSGLILQTVFMGGGTPSVLSRPALRKLLSAVRPSTSTIEEWTVEANPESIDAEFLTLCAEAGVTRISAGIQSTDDRHLRTLRRTGKRHEIDRALGLMRDLWQGDLNFDFIAGIPGQEPNEVRRDLSLLDQFPATHVSLYSLTYEPETPLSRLVEQGAIKRNSEEKDEELWFAGRDELSRRGYRQYEISNFSLPGRECRHNMRYWRIEPYIGVGPGAVSTLPLAGLARVPSLPRAGSASPVVRISNPKDIGLFLQGREKLWGAQAEVIEPEDFLLETLMMGLRLEDGLSAARLERRFGQTFEELFPGLWSSWVKRGFAKPAGEMLALTDNGRMLLDGLLADAESARERTTARELIVQWP